MFVSCECCVLLGRGLCDGLITRPENSYRLWCIVVYDLKPRERGGPGSLGGSCKIKEVLERDVLNALFRIIVIFYSP
jgi:hypothetical protein